LINSPDIRSFALALQNFCRPCPQVVWGEFLPATGCAKSPEFLGSGARKKYYLRAALPISLTPGMLPQPLLMHI